MTDGFLKGISRDSPSLWGEDVTLGRSPEGSFSVERVPAVILSTLSSPPIARGYGFCVSCGTRPTFFFPLPSGVRRSPCFMRDVSFRDIHPRSLSALHVPLSVALFSS